MRTQKNLQKVNAQHININLLLLTALNQTITVIPRLRLYFSGLKIEPKSQTTLLL